MKLSHLNIRNLRSFENVDIPLGEYTCLVGSNGAGKSTVLCALNVFFRETENSATDLIRLHREDFFQKNVSEPIEITVTFTDLSAEAESDFRDYYRQGKLIISAVATFNAETGRADVKQYGQRLGLEDFKPFFRAFGDGAPATELKTTYEELRTKHDLPKPGSKDAMGQALREYEAARPETCILIPSEDQFYGVSKGVNRLAKYVQWVYVPAVKDATTEQIEARDTALGKLLSRTVRSKTNFSESVSGLRSKAKADYEALLEANQHVLDDLSTALQARLVEWAHPDATLQLQWRQDPEKSVRVEEPWAQVLAGEGDFQGELGRLGHGLQRSYIIALLQELASAGGADGPRLILGCEEPELYQHPPQARHLADVLKNLSRGNSQVLVSTHSPLFVSGYAFEDVRVVRRDHKVGRSTVSFATIDDIAAAVSEATGGAVPKREGALAKIHQALQPSLCEMFFTPRLVLVEGLEDIAYIQAYFHLMEKWGEYRRTGCHIVPTNKKSEIAPALAIARKLGIPTLVIFDADSDVTDHEKRERHIKDNIAILKLCGLTATEPMPKETFWASNAVMWTTNIGAVVEEDIGKQEWQECRAKADKAYGHVGGLRKNTLHVGASLTFAWESGLRAPSLERLCNEILAFGGVTPATKSGS